MPTRILILPLFFAYAACPAADPTRDSLPGFFRSEYARHAAAIARKLAPEYLALCKAAGASDTASANRDSLMPLLFQHQLLTSVDAVDCRRGGVLGTVYFWHWITPNPRHRLRRLSDSTPLVLLPPPAGFGKFKTWADVDRLPSLYLGDLATEQPRYLHPRCGAIETFGWCSEREMAFGTLLAVQGVRAKIKQQDIHVWSEALFDLRGKDGKPRPTVVAFDNTFATVEAWPLQGSGEAWARDFGNGADVRWYNKVSHSADQAARVRAIAVGPEAAKRMSGRIEAWLAGR